MPQDTHKGKVLVVVPNYNARECVERCIASVIEQTYSPIEIVVVDNSSTDGSDKLIAENFPKVRMIQSGYNAGWGIACNVGMHSSESQYIALINNDAYLDKNCIAEMVKAIEGKPEYGSCASRILLWDDPQTTEVAGLVIYRDGSSVGRGRLGPADRYMQSEEVFCANDCCCLYKREMIREIGDYDPDFFIYCDETDMGWRHQVAGWKCVYSPQAVAYHAHSRSAGSYSEFKAFHVERNRIFICIKYFPPLTLLLSFAYSIYRYLYMVFLSGKKKKGALAQYRKSHSLWAGLAVLIKAHWAALLKLPVMWKRRGEIARSRKISPRELNQLFIQYGISTKQMASYE